MATENIYQRIFDADIANASGIRPLLKGDRSVKTEGHIRVSESSDNKNANDLFQEIRIPDEKLKSYQLAEALFDNYDLLSSVADDITAQESQQVETLLEHVIDTAPMRLARDYIAAHTGMPISDNSWYAQVKETWFRPFPVGNSPIRTGFEHVFLGEWKSGGNKVGGLHWWYFYYKKMNNIEYKGAIYNNNPDGFVIPEIATMSFSWDVGATKLTKPIGGFLVGPSVEGLMAMGMVRANPDAAAPNVATLEGAEIEFKLYKSPDGRSVHTFFPVFKRVVLGAPSAKLAADVLPAADDADNGENGGAGAGGKSNTAAGVRIIGALVNPDGGNEAGRENVTIMNLNGKEAVNLKGWRVVSPTKKFMVIGDIDLVTGESYTFKIPARGPLKLSNKGGTISLQDAEGAVVHSVEYGRESARLQGVVLFWDGDKLVNPAVEK